MICVKCGKEFEPEYGKYRNFCLDCNEESFYLGWEYQEYLDDIAQENDIKVKTNTTNAYIKNKLDEKGISYMSKEEFLNNRK